MTKAMSNGTFIRLEHALVRGKVWRSLSGGAVKLLIDIWDQFNGRNNGQLRYGVTQAMQCLQCSKRTALRRFRELEDAGLIEAVERASFSNKVGAGKGMTTAWRLTFLPCPRSP